jgi:predicted DCC family thiol-disulfide oxidoreductase YuxK
MDHAAAHSVVLFDGVCNLCNGFVRFVIRRDPRGRFRFASLQSDAAANLLQRHGIHEAVLESVILVESGRVFARSTAALRIARRLRFPWPLAYGLIAIPRPLRNAMYDWVAHNRYHWFGKREACMIPTPELRARFME